VASLSQGRTAAAQCGLFTHKSVPVIFEPPCTFVFKFWRLGSSGRFCYGIQGWRWSSSLYRPGQALTAPGCSSVHNL